MQGRRYQKGAPAVSGAFGSSFDVVVVGAEHRTWDDFTGQDGGTIRGGEAFELSVVARSALEPGADLTGVDTVKVDRQAYDLVQSHGFGTFIRVAGRPFQKKGRIQLQADSLAIVETSGELRSA